MTTILVTRRQIGWDSQLHFGELKMTIPTSKVFINTMGVWATAGNTGFCNRAIKAIMENVELPAVPGLLDGAADAGGWEVMRIWRDEHGDTCRMFWSETSPFGFTPPETFGMGSGTSFVMGAFAACGDVLESLKLAADHDTGTGGGLFVEDLDAMLAYAGEMQPGDDFPDA